MDDMLANGLMDCKRLWVLFPPNTKIYVHSGGHGRLYQVDDVSHMLPEQPLMKCEYIDFDGSKFKYVGTRFHLPYHKGLKSIQELDYIPVSMYQDDQVQKTLSTRGRKFEGLNGIHYRSFSGVARVFDSHMNAYREVPMHNARIVIDPARYSEGKRISTSEKVAAGAYGNEHHRKRIAKGPHKAEGTSNMDAASEEPMKNLTDS